MNSDRKIIDVVKPITTSENPKETEKKVEETKIVVDEKINEKIAETLNKEEPKKEESK